jgi:hypothetical protein
MKTRGLGLLLTAAAAYGYYKYSKMTPQEKSNAKARGKDFLDKNLSGLKNMFGKRSGTVSSNGY